MKQSGGFLYLFGDSNVAVISNVQTTSGITTYLNQNLDPQVGCAWPDTVQIFGQSIVFANTQGVFLLSGGTVTKVSKDLSFIFSKISSTLTPTAAVATLFGVKCYLILLQSVDQNNSLRNYMCVTADFQNWFVASQSVTLTGIYPQELNSQLAAWGSTGQVLVPLFQTPNTGLQKILKTKQFGGGNDDEFFIAYKKLYRFYSEVFDYSAAGVNLSGTLDSNLAAGVSFSTTGSTTTFQFTNSTLGVINFSPSGGGTILWGIQGPSTNYQDASIYGNVLGATLNFSGSDFSFTALTMLYSYDAPFGG